MDALFKAVSDRGRRKLLDALREKDGQTLTELLGVLGGMTRFGVMKHLKILEKAGLVTTRRMGRFKYHYLNVVPIQQMADRWISEFLSPWARQMPHLKSNVERRNNMAESKPKHVLVTIIQASAAEVWRAITDPQRTREYFFETEVISGWKPGGSIAYRMADGKEAVFGEILEIEEGRRLSHTFNHNWEEDEELEPASRVTYELEEVGDATRLTLIHDDFDGETKTYQQVGGGWPVILSGMKTLLETGKPLRMK